MGRPSSYTEEIADEICEALATGEALYLMCQAKAHWPAERTVYQWLEKNEDFAQKYARARERQADRRNEEIIVIADTATDANLARVQIEARKWQASKLAPKKYGDRTQVDQNVNISWASIVEDAEKKRLERMRTIEAQPMARETEKDGG